MLVLYQPQNIPLVGFHFMTQIPNIQLKSHRLTNYLAGIKISKLLPNQFLINSGSPAVSFAKASSVKTHKLR